MHANSFVFFTLEFLNCFHSNLFQILIESSHLHHQVSSTWFYFRDLFFLSRFFFINNENFSLNFYFRIFTHFWVLINRLDLRQWLGREIFANDICACIQFHLRTLTYDSTTKGFLFIRLLVIARLSFRSHIHCCSIFFSGQFITWNSCHFLLMLLATTETKSNNNNDVDEFFFTFSFLVSLAFLLQPSNQPTNK